jgi:hypothetical protein
MRRPDVSGALGRGATKVRLATVRYEGRAHAARVEDDHVELLPATDVGALLAGPGGLEAARAAAVARVPTGVEPDLAISCAVDGVVRQQ